MRIFSEYHRQRSSASAEELKALEAPIRHALKESCPNSLYDWWKKESDEILRKLLSDEPFSKIYDFSEYWISAFVALCLSWHRLGVYIHVQFDANTKGALVQIKALSP